MFINNPDLKPVYRCIRCGWTLKKPNDYEHKCKEHKGWSK